MNNQNEGIEMQTTEFMRSIDTRYRESSGLTERCYYSIFYSQVIPSKVFVLGFNPGGNPEKWDDAVLASRSLYENGEHEYVDCEYPLAKAMRTFLYSTLSLTDINQIRKIPKTNLIFRRSSSQDTLKCPKLEALLEAKPFIEEMLQRVQPLVIIFEGMETLKKFRQLYCTTVTSQKDNNPLTTPNGRNNARIFETNFAKVTCLTQRILLIGIGHPSKYALRAEWSNVLTRSKEQIESYLNSPE